MTRTAPTKPLRAGHARDLDDVAGVRRLDEVAAADVHADVVEAVVEDEVARCELARRDVGARGPEGAREVRKPAEARLGVGPGDEARAVEAARCGAAPDVRRAELLERLADGRLAQRRGRRRRRAWRPGRRPRGRPRRWPTGAGSLDCGLQLARLPRRSRSEAAFSAARRSSIRRRTFEAQAAVAPLVGRDRAVDLRLQRLQLGDVVAPRVALAVERALAAVDLLLVVADVREDARVVAVGAVEQGELLEHLAEVAGLERRLQRIGLRVLVGADDRDVERVARMLEVGARGRQPHVVLVDPLHRLLRGGIARRCSARSPSRGCTPSAWICVPDPVGLGTRIADLVGLGRRSHANADAHRTEREDRDVAATPAGPVEGPRVAARGEHPERP